jgi:hypothetical protein
VAPRQFKAAAAGARLSLDEQRNRHPEADGDTAWNGAGLNVVRSSN